MKTFNEWLLETYGEKSRDQLGWDRQGRPLVKCRKCGREYTVHTPGYGSGNLKCPHCNTTIKKPAQQRVKKTYS